MKFRKTHIDDIDDIMKIIDQAQRYFKENGIDQWQNNYPNKDVIINDLNNDESYVLADEEKVIATAAISFNGENTYDTIYDGKWISNNKYAVIHRIAVDNNYKGKGISTRIIKEVEGLCIDKKVNSIKVDTHEDNISMQNLLKKNDFKYCGVIYLKDNSKRIAFEKIIK